MTDLPEGQLVALLGYIGVVREALRMQNWDVILHRTAHELDDIWAHTWTADNHFAINIEVCQGLLDEKAENVRNAMVHELIHAQHRNVNTLWEACTQTNDDVSKNQALQWNEDYNLHMERFVSWIVTRIEGTVPLFDVKIKYPIVDGCYILGDNPA